MKHKTFFRLMIKVVGILLLGYAIPKCIAGIAMYAQMESFRAGLPGAGPASGGRQMSNMYLAAVLDPTLTAIIGAYLLFGGTWLIDKIIPSNRPYCPHCGYDVTETHGDVCTECGGQLPKPKLSATEESTDNE